MLVFDFVVVPYTNFVTSAYVLNTIASIPG